MSNNNHLTLLSQYTTKGSLVDRTIYSTFPKPLPTVTPTSLPHTSLNHELLHRLNGTSILSQCATLLRLSASTYATSTSIFHRFYHRKSLREHDVWSTSLGCVVLACKVEEEIRKVREIILVFVHVYRRMRFAMGCQTTISLDDGSELFRTAFCPLLTKSKNLSEEERQNILRYIQPLPRRSQLYKEWESELMNMENIILRELGFSLYWIPESHPHVFLLYFMKVLDLVDSKDTNVKNEKNDGRPEVMVGQIAWNYCNDSCRLDLCVRYEAQIITCAAIYLASVHEKVLLPTSPRPWWHVFIGPYCDEKLSTVCNSLLALHDKQCIVGYEDSLKKYIVSLVDGGSFNDPGSYVWSITDNL